MRIFNDPSPRKNKVKMRVVLVVIINVGEVAGLGQVRGGPSTVQLPANSQGRPAAHPAAQPAEV